MPVISMIRKVLPSAGVSALALVLAMAGCVEEQVAGSTTTGNTGKGAIAGRVVDAGGNGVAGAKVRVVPVNHNPGPGGSDGLADIVVTGADGRFMTDSLPDGSYNLFSDKEGSLAFRDSVPVTSDSGTDAGRDTLKAPGSVAGVVRLQPGHDSRTVFLILLGTTTFALPADSIGNFRLGNLAEGTYRLRLLSTLDAYQPVDTVITVASGVDQSLPDTLRLPYRPVPVGVPTIDDVSLSYDTTAMAVTLRWGRRNPALVGSYRVYRRSGEMGFVQATQSPLADTQFTEDWRSGLEPWTTYHYAVTAVDPQGYEGRKGEEAIFTMRVRFQVQSTGQNCQPAACQYTLSPEGDLWVYLNGGHVVKHAGIAEERKWFDSAALGGMTRPLTVDGEGSVYILDPDSLRLRKHATDGRELWRTQVPAAAGSLSLHRVSDTLLLWDEAGRVMTAYATDGRFLGRDTVLRLYQPPTGNVRLSYQPEIGFYSVVSSVDLERIEFLDREGRITSTWKPEVRGQLRGLARGADGRWYLGWSKAVIDIYSPERIPIASLLPGGEGPIRVHGGLVYMQRMPGELLQITTGY